MKKKYITWIISAKKQETKDKRLIEAIKKLNNKEKIK
ncbi:YdeI/OmpD-associated family protein [Clostridium celatum]|nr:YdeI/OmpD-associated family protein [Clostridium celatum]MDU3724508.1 YdeI/OmpD-associated family protein [Clostridium celatum]MDU6296218.1 YdeI/OmpD-associated family protein [Clostridium celatum]MDY3360671.1 YdeI/OmpD-associated family protein [Clostridium celatum]